MLGYLDAVTGCLDRAWRAKFSQAGAVFLEPSRVYWSRPGRGPCGTYPTPDASAYYCPANRGMYIGLDHVIQQSDRIDPARNHVPYLTVLAHEYAHHVQSMAGIGGAWWWEVSVRSRAAQEAHSRRNELQAQCLAGVFVRTVRVPLGVTNARWREVLRTEHGRGDDQNGGSRRDHGNGEHYAAWLHQGWKYARAAHCNTSGRPPLRGRLIRPRRRRSLRAVVTGRGGFPRFPGPATGGHLQSCPQSDVPRGGMRTPRCRRPWAFAVAFLMAIFCLISGCSPGSGPIGPVRAVTEPTPSRTVHLGSACHDHR